MTGELPNHTTLTLTDQEAELFIDFRRYQEQFQMLVDNGVFQVKSGSVKLDINKDSNIRKIEVSSIKFYQPN